MILGVECVVVVAGSALRGIVLSAFEARDLTDNRAVTIFIEPVVRQARQAYGGTKTGLTVATAGLALPSGRVQVQSPHTTRAVGDIAGETTAAVDCTLEARSVVR